MISVFELFSIGMGPSSSHTVGPMRAAHAVARNLFEQHLIDKTSRVTVELFGSLALTGRGHATNIAVILGLTGDLPESVDTETTTARFEEIGKTKRLHLYGKHEISFDLGRDLIWHTQEVLPYHSNGMRFRAYDQNNNLCYESIQYSIGGGFVVTNEQLSGAVVEEEVRCPYPFQTAQQLLEICEDNHMTIAQIMHENEKIWRDSETIQKLLMKIWSVMDESIERGMRRAKGELPGGLRVKLRAPGLYEKLQAMRENGQVREMDWISLFAIAVNEENAGGRRIVTAPTNGAAGIIPAVLKYYLMFHPYDNYEKVVTTYLLTCAAIGILYKKNASISAAEVGCQGEVGVACSMAAAGLAALLGGDIFQVETAAETGMEHHLGLTCDPIGGLVQIPCIERNAMGSIQAVGSALLAILGDGQHYVSLDQVIRAMMETGRDMSTKYKETALGGLAVSQPAC